MQYNLAESSDLSPQGSRPSRTTFLSIRFSTIRLAAIYFLCDSLKICINDKWFCQLLVKILKLYCTTFLQHPNRLFSIYYHTHRRILNKYLFGAETLKAMHAKILSVLLLSLTEHHSVKMFHQHMFLLIFSY